MRSGEGPNGTDLWTDAERAAAWTLEEEADVRAASAWMRATGRRMAWREAMKVMRAEGVRA